MMLAITILLVGYAIGLAIVWSVVRDAGNAFDMSRDAFDRYLRMNAPKRKDKR